ncbi:MAG: organic hydroperoxide resistance protein [Phycisphaerales bacterium]
MPAALDKVLYTARAHTTGGREGGASRTDDGRLDLRISPPGAPGDGVNPEQLFAAGWSTCYLSALKVVATQRKMRLPEGTAVDAEIDLGTNAGGYQLAARLYVSIPTLDPQTAQELADAAHQICPYSKATRGNINVTIHVV